MLKIKTALSHPLNILFLLGAVSLAGCQLPEIPGDSGDQSINQEKTQLYVFNYDGGYGTDWLYSAKTRYEKLHEDDVWEKGKKGVQIILNPAKIGVSDNAILGNRDDVYYTEDVDYMTSVNKNIFADITDAVTGDNPYEPGKTVLSKFNDVQKSYYAVDKDGSKHYYGIPSYGGYFGLVYNIDLFKSQGFYFKDGAKTDGELWERFVQSDTDKKTAGPDGLFDTDDDGLPVTYDDFYALCDYIYSNNVTPIVWSGLFYEKQVTGLFHSCVTSNEGADQMMLTYTMDGEAKTLGVINDGAFVADSSSTAITEKNGYELGRRKGIYDATSFIKKIVTTEKYQCASAFNTGFTHMNAQEYFLKSGEYDGVNNPSAMLVDGVWWEQEAVQTFKTMVDAKGDSWSRNNRHYGWMPLPESSTEAGEVVDPVKGKKGTLFEDMYSCSFVKSTIEDWKKPLAIDFLKFMNTDESLSEYSVITDTPKALNYTMSETDLAKMSPYGRSLLKYKENCNIVYPLSRAKTFINNQSVFRELNVYGSMVNGLQRTSPVSTFHEHPEISPESYFTGIYTFLKNKNIWGQ